MQLRNVRLLSIIRHFTSLRLWKDFHNRKNFKFADTEAGAESMARVFSMIETVRANDHNPHKDLSVLLTELPNVKTADDINALLPWEITPDQIAQRYAAYPVP